MIAAFLIAAALVQQTDSSQEGRPCRMVIDSVGSYGRQVEAEAGVSNFFAGGGVRTHCEGTDSRLAADSVAYYGGTGRFHMLGNVRLRDATLSLDATTATYYLREERLEAHRKVVAVNLRTGSVLRGPNLTYFRAARGVRDTTEMRASSRPTIDYRAAGDTGEPWVLTADRVRLLGDDRLWGGGNVLIDRSTLAARADSMTMDQTAGLGVLLGRPRVEGKGASAYTLVGRRIDLVLQDGDLRQVKAQGAGEATGDDWRLTADTIHLAVERNKLQEMVSWGDSTRPRAVSGRVSSRSPRDTLARPGDLDWITGDTLVARFAQAPDTAGTTRTELQQIIARGAARSLTHLYENDERTGDPAINYSRGTHIALVLKGDHVDRVTVTGRADGAHLERLPPPPDTTAAPTP